MSTTHTEFDRTFFKTHKSRSAILTPAKTEGFTLIELLVVISIIALLSTVVLAAVGDARMKARNTAKNGLVLEYVKALELYRSDNGGNYPMIPSSVCVGYTDSESCAFNFSGSTILKNSLTPYLSGNFADRQPINSNVVGNLSGVWYTYDSINQIYALTWILENSVSSCVDKASQNDDYFGHTRCDFTLR